MCDAELVFSTFKHGFSLLNLYNKCSERAEDSTIILIKNNKKVVFGAFVDAKFTVDSINSAFKGSKDSFVFSLFPNERKYESTGFNNDHLRCETEYFSMGSEGFL